MRLAPPLNRGGSCPSTSCFTRRATYPIVLLRDHRFFWNEQYLVEAFLAFNDHFEILLPMYHMYLSQRDRLVARCPAQADPRMLPPTSFWFRRTGQGKPACCDLGRALSAQASSRLLYLIAAAFVFVVLARLLGPEQLGQYAWATSFLAIAMALADGGMSPVLARDLVRMGGRRDAWFANFLAVRLALGTLVALGGIVVAMLFAPPPVRLPVILCCLVLPRARRALLRPGLPGREPTLPVALPDACLRCAGAARHRRGDACDRARALGGPCVRRGGHRLRGGRRHAGLAAAEARLHGRRPGGRVRDRPRDGADHGVRADHGAGAAGSMC